MSADFGIIGLGIGLLGAAVAVAPIVGAGYLAYKGVSAASKYAKNKQRRKEEERRVQEQLRQQKRESYYSEMMDMREKYQDALGHYEQLAAQLESQFGRRMEELGSRFEAELGAVGAGGLRAFERQFEQDKQRIVQDFEEQRRNLEDAYHRELNAAVKDISARFSETGAGLHMASEALKQDMKKAEASRAMLERAQGTLELYRAESGNNAERLSEELRSAERYHNEGSYDMAYSKASGVAAQCLGLIEETKKQQLTFFQLSDSVSDMLFVIDERLAKARQVQFRFGNEIMSEDLTRYEPALFQGIADKLGELKSSFNRLGSFKREYIPQLRQLYTECASLDEDIVNVAKYATAKMAFGYSENSQAEIVTDALEEQGFEMVDYAYEGDTEGNVMHVNYQNAQTGEQLTAVLTPDGRGVNISVHNFGSGIGTGNRKTQEAVQRALEKKLNTSGVCRNPGGVSTERAAAQLANVRAMQRGNTSAVNNFASNL